MVAAGTRPFNCSWYGIWKFVSGKKPFVFILSIEKNKYLTRKSETTGFQSFEHKSAVHIRG